MTAEKPDVIVLSNTSKGHHQTEPSYEKKRADEQRLAKLVESQSLQVDVLFGYSVR
jgi:hypothetical protein